MTTGNTGRPMGSMTMSKVSTKTDQALASSPSGSMPPVSPGSVISGTTTPRSRTTRQSSNRQASFSAHLKNARDEHAGGAQDHTPPHETGAHVAKTTSAAPKGTTAPQAGQTADQTSAPPSATTTSASQIAQSADTAADRSPTNQAKKIKSGPDTTSDSATAFDLTSQSLQTDILSQTLGFQQSLPPSSSQEQGVANQADAAAQTTVLPQALALPSDPQVAPTPLSGTEAADQSSFASILAQIPDDQQVTTAAAQSTAIPSVATSQNHPAVVPAQHPATQLPGESQILISASSPTTASIPMQTSAHSPSLASAALQTTMPATARNNLTATPTQTPDNPQKLASNSPQPATTIPAIAQSNLAAAPAQTPDSPQKLASNSPQPATTIPAITQGNLAAAPAQTPDNPQNLASVAPQPSTAVQNNPTAAPTQTSNNPQIVTTTAHPLEQSELQTAATTAHDFSQTSPDTSSIQEDIAATMSTSSARQSSLENQAAQHRSPSSAALSLSPDNPTDPVTGITSLPDGTEGLAPQSGAHGSTSGESASADDNRDDTNSPTASQTTTSVNLPPGIMPSGSFAAALNDSGTATQKDTAPKETGGAHGTDGTIIAPPLMAQSDDGSTSLSMTIMTDDSTPVHVRLEGTDGLTTGVFLQSEDIGTARHLADNRHELVAALSAAGVDVSNLKIDVVTAGSNNSDNFQNQNQNQNADGTAYNGSLSGNMFGGNSGQNGQQSYSGTAWNTNSVMSDLAAGNPETQDGSHSIRPSGPHAGRGINITA